MSLGNFMMMVALGWLVLEMTDSPLSLGMVWATHSAPHLIWGMLAGAVADKVDRRRLLIWVFIDLAACTFTLKRLGSALARFPFHIHNGFNRDLCYDRPPSLCR
jgi:MFS family permease